MSSKQSQIKAIRGMNDILPQDSALWSSIEQACIGVLDKHGYKQIRTPIVESTSLFTRSIGSDTDIVAKEMYTFDDRNGDRLSLRPEGTASCVRSGIQHGLFYHQQQRLWYIGPMFRHERPQKGRYRQFHQIGVESYGWSTPDIEAEIISISAQIISALGLKKTNLQINSLGDTDARSEYRDALVEYLKQYESELDEDSKRRLKTNPLRILDSKNPETQALLTEAPNILDFLSASSRDNFSQLQTYLQQLGIDYTINPRLVRGLDYYNDTVFEWVSEDFGAQATVCAGGRYDSMVEQLGGTPTPGVGFAMGLERLILILQEQEAAITQVMQQADVYIVSSGDSARAQALVLQRDLAQSGCQVLLHCGQASIKNQFKHADKSGAKLALVIGDEEAVEHQVGVKVLVRREEQQTIAQNEVLNVVTNLLESL